MSQKLNTGIKCLTKLRISKHRFRFAIFYAQILFLILNSVATASFDEDPDTLLMFVGEDLEVLSIATRREESAWQVPAIADVITRQKILDQGLSTLADALSTVPGFYMDQKEWGRVPFLRGVPNSILFLYDTVPLGSYVTKSLNPLEYDLSFASVKRIEIVRGQGSVLWGPDAFAGIVNIVPLSGKDVNGVEFGSVYGTPGDHVGGYVNFGIEKGFWDIFGSISTRYGEKDDTSCNIVRFLEDDGTLFPPEMRSGSQRPDNARYIEATGRLSYENWLNITTRISDYRVPYALTEDGGSFTWCEERDVNAGQIKLEGQKKINLNSGVRVIGSFAWIHPDHEIIDLSLSQEEQTSNVEILYDSSFMSGSGLLTLGGGYRHTDVSNAPIWDGYIPEFIDLENEIFVPDLTLVDYSTSLWSIFGQYSHKIKNWQFLAGIRYDNHDEYEDNVSYNLGAVWSPMSDWIAKLFWGTAYRTPFSSQLREEGEIDLEKINNVNIQVSWRPSKIFKTSASIFFSRLESHVMEDPYAGISVPNDQDIQGVELEVSMWPHKNLELNANMSFIDHSGPTEIYKFNDFTFFRPDGTIEKHFIDLFYPYNSGPTSLFNISAIWNPHEQVTTTARVKYFSSRKLIHPRGESFESVPGEWIVDWNLLLKKFPTRNSELQFEIKNLLDNDYKNPGTYFFVDGEPISLQIYLRVKW